MVVQGQIQDTGYRGPGCAAGAEQRGQGSESRAARDRAAAQRAWGRSVFAAGIICAAAAAAFLKLQHVRQQLVARNLQSAGAGQWHLASPSGRRVLQAAESRGCLQLILGMSGSRVVLLAIQRTALPRSLHHGSSAGAGSLAPANPRRCLPPQTRRPPTSPSPLASTSEISSATSSQVMSTPRMRSARCSCRVAGEG